MIVVIDIETDCADPETANIIELGAVVLTGARRGEVFRCEMDHTINGKLIVVNSIGAARVNGQTLGYFGDALSPAICVNKATKRQGKKIADLLEWLDFRSNRSITIAGINPHFDRRILLRYMEVAGIENDGFIRHNLLDLHTVALQRRHQSASILSYLSSDPIFYELGLVAEPKPHRALVGAFWEACGFWSQGIGIEGESMRKRIAGSLETFTDIESAMEEIFNPSTETPVETLATRKG